MIRSTEAAIRRCSSKLGVIIAKFLRTSILKKIYKWLVFDHEILSFRTCYEECISCEFY